MLVMCGYIPSHEQSYKGGRIMMHMTNEFITLTRRGEYTCYINLNYHNLCLWLEDWFPGYSFTVDTDITDNTIAVSISKVLPADDIGNKETHVACAKIPIVFIINNDDYRIRQVVQNAIYGR